MIILGIETSCDETACAVLQKDKDSIHILSNVVASSASLQAKYGGVIPEQAAREQIKSIIPVIKGALNQAFPKDRLPRPAKSGARNDKIRIDAIAVTQGPGLIGSLLVGVETAKTLALVWDKPLIPVNHLIGHFYANWIVNTHLPGVRAHLGGVPKFPCLGLLVSGGHTDLVLFKDHGKYQYLGGTRDDAAGECFDKCARLLGLPYPGGPEISKLAKKGNPKVFNLPRPMMKDFSSIGRPSSGWDFSFSGLKTAVANLIKENHRPGKIATSGQRIDPPRNDRVKSDLAASIEQAIVDVLVAKAVRAAREYKVEQIIVAGGVAANQELVRNLKFKIKNLKLKAQLFVPPVNLCTDNAAMVASAAFFQKPIKDPLSLQADPNLSLS